MDRYLVSPKRRLGRLLTPGSTYLEEETFLAYGILALGQFINEQYPDVYNGDEVALTIHNSKGNWIAF
jgi:hypothetical protein